MNRKFLALFAAFIFFAGVGTGYAMAPIFVCYMATPYACTNVSIATPLPVQVQ